MKKPKLTVYVVSYNQYDGYGELDYSAVKKVFYDKKEANAFKEKQESETWGTFYYVDKIVVEQGTI